jgi:hypothetical protein
MAANELYKEDNSFGLANSIPIQVFIARQKADQLDESGVSQKKGGSG